MTSRGKQMVLASQQILIQSHKNRRRISPNENAEFWCSLGIDPDGFKSHFISDFKGMGVFTEKAYRQGDFLLEYSGERISADEGDRRLKKYCRKQRECRSYLFFYQWRGVRYCVDATMGQNLCRLVNDAQPSQANCKMKLIPATNPSHQPRLCLFAVRNIPKHNELLYDYGDDITNLWWRRSGNFGEVEGQANSTEDEPTSSATATAQRTGDAVGTGYGISGVEMHNCGVQERATEDEHPMNDKAFDEDMGDNCIVQDHIPSDAKNSTEDVVNEDMRETDCIATSAENPEIIVAKESWHTRPASNHVSGCAERIYVDMQHHSGHQQSKRIRLNVQEHKAAITDSMVADIADEFTNTESHSILQTSGTKGSRMRSKLNVQARAENRQRKRQRVVQGIDDADADVIDEDDSGSDYLPTDEMDSEDDCTDTEGFVNNSNYEDINVTDDTHPAMPQAIAMDGRDECEEPTNLRGKYRNVTIPSYRKTNGGRNYSKIDYCYFCENPFNASIAKHYQSMHANETEVQKILSIDVKSKHRKVAWTKLRNLGNYKYNTKVLQVGEGQLIISRRPREEATKNYKPQDFLPCEFCYSFVLKDSLWTHVKTCPYKPESQQPEANYVRNARTMLAPFLSDCNGNEMDTFFGHMKNTKDNPGLVEICRQDGLINEFAKSLLDRVGREGEQRKKEMDNMRTKVRTLGRLLQNMNQSTNTTMPLMAYFTGKHFRTVVQSVKNLSMKADSPQLALTLGHYVKQTNLLKISLGIEHDDEVMKKEGEDFKSLYISHWNNKVACIANRRQKLRQINKPYHLPTTEDLVQFRKWLGEELASGRKKNRLTENEWVHFAHVCLARILLFNKRRVAEVEEIKVNDFKERAAKSHTNDEIMQSLDVAERALVKRMDLIEVRGKSTRGIRKVFVLLSEDMVVAIEHLLRTRTFASHFVFGRKSNTPMDGCAAMRRLTALCPGLKDPTTIRSRSLRKYMATCTQILDMNQSELKMVADHLGHNIDIHTDIYRLQDSVLERTKVARVLLAVENGNIGKFSGKTLQDINPDDLAVPVICDDEWAMEAPDQHAMEDVRKLDRINDNDTFDVHCCDTGDVEVHARKDASYEKDMDSGRRLVKKTWTQMENKALYASFKDIIVNKRSVKAEVIRQARDKFPCLSDRTDAQIRAKIHNITSGKEKIKCNF